MLLNFALNGDSIWLQETAIRFCRMISTPSEQIQHAIRGRLFERYINLELHKVFSLYRVLFSSPSTFTPLLSYTWLLAGISVLQLILIGLFLIYCFLIGNYYLLAFFAIMGLIALIDPEIRLQILLVAGLGSSFWTSIFPSHHDFLAILFIAGALSLLSAVAYLLRYNYPARFTGWVSLLTEIILIILRRLYTISYIILWIALVLGGIMLPILLFTQEILVVPQHFVSNFEIIFRITFWAIIIIFLIWLIYLDSKKNFAKTGELVNEVGKVVNFSGKSLVNVIKRNPKIIGYFFIIGLIIYYAFRFVEDCDLSLDCLRYPSESFLLNLINVAALSVCVGALLQGIILVLKFFLKEMFHPLQKFIYSYIREQATLRVLSMRPETRPTSASEAIKKLRSFEFNSVKLRYVHALQKWLPRSTDWDILIQEADMQNSRIRDGLYQLVELWQDSTIHH